MRVFFDSSFWIALYRDRDLNHQAAFRLKQQLPREAELYINNLIVYETLTVLSLRESRSAALQFGEYIFRQMYSGRVWPSMINESRERSSWNIFRTIANKGISFTDCSILQAIREYQIDVLLSFDKDFKKFKKPYKFKLNAV